MGIDTIKVIYTYGIATIIVVGGLGFLYFSRNDPAGGQSASMVPLVAGFIGAAIQFVFNRETAAQSSAATERAVAIQAPQPTVTVSGNPPTTTVTPAEVPANP